MARTHYVKSRRVGKKGEYVLRCQTCGESIEYGAPYKYFTMKMSYGGVKKAYHEACSIPASHRTTSRMGEIYDAQEALDLDACEDTDAMQAELASFAEAVRSVAEGYQESADNMESGFGHSTYQSEELAERASSLEDWADTLESVDFEEFEEPGDELRMEICETLPQEDDESEEDYDERIDAEVEVRTDELRDEWLSEQRDLAQQATDECPC